MERERVRESIINLFCVNEIRQNDLFPPASIIKI